MAETKTLRTRIKLLYKSYAEWDSIKSTFVPLMGEVCFCEVPATTGVVTNEPCVLFKVGDGVKTFAELPWTSSTAADVSQWAKKNALDFADLDDNFREALEQFIEQHSTSVDTQYRIVSDGDYAWKLQKSVDGESWEDTEGAIDVSELNSKIEAEIARAKAEEARKTTEEIVSAKGKSWIKNESSGGGAYFRGNDGYNSFVGVNENTKDGIGAQIYDIDSSTSKGSKIDVTASGVFYTTGDESAKPATQRDVEANEIATKKDISALHIPEYTLTTEADPGDYAAIYHLTKDGVNVGAAINIAKDQLLKSVEIKTCVEKDVPVTGLEVGDKYMDFTFIVEKGEEAHTYIAIKDMVKPYTAGDGIVITSENAITFDEEVIASVEYVDANISDTMSFIIQERNTERAARIAGDEARELEILPVSAYGFNTNLRVNQQVDGSALIDKVIEATNVNKKQVVIKSGDYKYNVISIVNDEVLGVKGFALETMFIPMESLEDKPALEKGIFLYNPALGKTCTFYDKDFTSEEIQQYAASVVDALDEEVLRAKAAEQALSEGKLNVLPNVDDPSDPGYGWPYHIPYNFDVTLDGNKATITLNTITLDNKVTKMSFTKELGAATQSTAGLMSAADKAKLDHFYARDLTQETGDVLILDCNL